MPNASRIEEYHVASKTRTGKWPFPLASKYPILAAPEVVDHITRCSRCFNCMVSSLSDYAPACPSWEMRRWEAYLPPGRIRIAQGLLRGLIEPTPSVVERVFYCTLCGACKENCAPIMALDPTVVIQALREQLVELGLGPMPEHKRFAEYTKVHHNIYGESRARRNAWMPERPNDKAEVVYFVGCTPAYRNTNIALSTYKILKTLGVNFTILDDEWCCGRTLLYTGQRHQAFDVFRRNMEAIESTGASMVVTSCPGCYGMFKSKYPRLTRTKLPFEVVHITEFLSKFGSNLKLSKEIKIKATYHDPCHLGRAEGIYNEPRYLLENIPGVSFNEMERIGRSSWCCGAGGGVLAAFPKFAEFTASSRLREATEYADADALVTACPFCHFNLSRTAETLGSSIKIYDIVELIAKAIS